MQMAWAWWADFAFRYQIRLVGWPADIGKVPRPGFNYKVDLKPQVLAKLVMAQIWALDDEDNTDDGPFCGIKSWTEGT